MGFGRVVVPGHGNKSLPVGTIWNILRQTGLTVAQLMELLSMRRYTVILTPESDCRAFNVTVPAFPGCFTWGTTVAEALKMARDAIATYLEGEEDAPADDSAIIASVNVPDSVPSVA